MFVPPLKRLIMLHVPTSICNFRCHYCYLAQREEAYQGKQAQMQYSPEQVAKALSYERMGGACFINSCAEGETLLTKDIDLYYKALVEEGHFLEIVTNMTITHMVHKILNWDRELLKRVEFKCSFHYLELVKRNLLDVFTDNVQKAWNAGASATIEVTPSDELIPYIPELREFSIKHFGAIPHLTIARDDRTKGIVKLTNLGEDEYRALWSQFDSKLWDYKMEIFGKKQTDFCYAGLWSVYVDIATGMAKACYFKDIGNIFEEPNKPIVFQAIGRCPIAYCYNGHAFMTYGLIPDSTKYTYAEMRNRIREDGTEWLQPELKEFFSGKLEDNNSKWSGIHKSLYLKSLSGKDNIKKIGRKIKRCLK